MESTTAFPDKFQFQYRMNPKKRNSFTNRITTRQDRKNRSTKTVTPTPTSSLPLPDDFDTTNLPRILENRTIYIHTKITDLVKLTQIAEGLGATVRTDMNKSVTHVVIEPRGDKRQLSIVKSAVSKGIVCVSSKWLLACYTQRKYCPTIAYQYDIHESSHMFDLPANQEEFNPFGTTYIDYDALEAQKPKNGGQLSMDGFVSRTRQLSITEQDQDTISAANTQFDTVPASVRSTSVEPEVIDEYYYNNSIDTTDITDTQVIESAEEAQANRIQSEQAMSEAHRLVEERRKLLEEEQKKKKPIKKNFVPSVVYGEKRLKIWYGPQSLQDELLSRKK